MYALSILALVGAALAAPNAVAAEAAPAAPAVTAPPCAPCSGPINAVPTCASQCILSAAVTAAGCADAAYSCQCAHSSAIQGAAINCVVGNCGFATGLAVLGSVSKVCQCVSTAGCGGNAARVAPMTAA